MNKQITTVLFLVFSFVLKGQGNGKVSQLFLETTPLEMKLSYSNKELRKDTNDSTLIDTELKYKHNGKWEQLSVRLRARGNIRRAECYFNPVKIKIKKS